MYTKRKLHHILTLIRKIHYSFLLGMCVFFAVTALLAMRANNQQMIELRSAVFAADKANGDAEGALQNLRRYVFKHMNTNLSSGFAAVKPPIQLRYRYERLQAAANAQYSAASTKMLNDAENICVAQYPGSVFSQARLSCARDYAAAHTVKQAGIPEDLYKFDFASPAWSPDLAGWSIVIAAVSLFLFVARFMSEAAIRRQLS